MATDNKQNLLLFAVIALFLVLKWGHLGLLFVAFFLLPGLAILQCARLSDEAKLALSFPVSLMLTSGLMFSLHRAGLDLPVDWFAIIPIAALGVLILNRSKFDIKPGSKEQIVAIIVFLLFLNTFYSALQKDAVPATDGSNHLYKTWVTLQGMEKYGKILEWSRYMYSGHTLFVFYPPLAYVSPAMLTHFSQVPVHRAFNFFAFWAVLYAGLGAYLLAKKVGVSELLAGGAATILITTPNLLGKVFFQGNYAIILAFSFLAIIAYLGLELKGRNLLWLAFPVAAVLMIHSLIFYYVAYLVLFAAFWLWFIKKEKTEGKFVVVALLMAALLSSSWLLPFLANFKLMHVAERPIPVSVPEFLNHIAFVPKDVADCAANSLQCMQSFTAVYILLFIFGAAAVLRSKNQNAIFVLLCLAVVITVIFAEITPLLKILPLREKMMGVGYRTYFFILPFFAVVCVYLADLIVKRIQSQKLKYAGILFFIILLFEATAFWIPAPDAWMTETAPIAGFEGDYEIIFNQIKNLDEGRLAIFGTYGPAINPAVALMANKDLFSGWGYETAGDIATTIYKIQDRDFNPGPEMSPQTNLAIYKATNTNHILIYFGSQIGSEIYNKTIFPILENYTITWALGNAAIFSIMPRSYFAEFISGEKIDYKRDIDSITLELKNTGALTVKESYFPNWQAYLNGKKIDLRKTDIGYMLMFPQEKGKLILKYELSWGEKLAGLINLIAVIGSVIIIYLWRSQRNDV